MTRKKTTSTVTIGTLTDLKKLNLVDQELEFRIAKTLYSFPRKLAQAVDLEPDDFVIDQARRVAIGLLEANRKHAGKDVDLTEPAVLGEYVESGDVELLDAYTDIIGSIEPQITALKQLAEKRKLAGVLYASYQDLITGERSPVDIMDDLKHKEVNHVNSISDTITSAQLADQAEKRLIDGWPFIKTGFSNYDDKYHGIGLAEFVIIAGSPGAGKSELMNQMALRMAKNGSPVYMVGLEMLPEDYQLRMACSLAKVNSQLVMGLRDDAARLWMESIDGQHYLDAQADLGAMPVIFRQRTSHDINDILKDMTTYVSKHGKQGAVYIDYLQLIYDRECRGTRNDELASVTGKIKQWVLEHRVPVVSGSQLNRGTRRTPGQRSQLPDLRDSGALEQDADIVVILHSPEADGMPSDNWPAYQTEQGTMILEAWFRKYRKGPTGPLYFLHTKRYNRLDELLVHTLS